MQLTVTLHVQLTAIYELKQQQKYLQSKLIYAIIGRAKRIMLLFPIIFLFGNIVLYNFEGKYFLPYFTNLRIQFSNLTKATTVFPLLKLNKANNSIKNQPCTKNRSVVLQSNAQSPRILNFVGLQRRNKKLLEG